MAGARRYAPYVMPQLYTAFCLLIATYAAASARWLPALLLAVAGALQQVVVRCHRPAGSPAVAQQDGG
jgi:hypothetical protein